ncbi:MAG: tRNA 5-methoxyuridine(34)/uridine 5-oxyacetic acid(34) synthase CmoB [Pseudomonadales bacterium]
MNGRTHIERRVTENLGPLFQAFPGWRALAEPACEQITRHGTSSDWFAALDRLPRLIPTTIRLDDTVTIGGTASSEEEARLRQALLDLHPWRKGPFRLFDVFIDSEWRSDWKWQRLVPHLPHLQGETVLDVGSGNGYFGWRLLGAGAARVVSVDPTALFYLQHLALSGYVHALRPELRNWLLPLPFEALPVTPFDTVLSMGVVYHRRDPLEHVRQLFAFTRPGGRVVLESLVVAAEGGLAPTDRYARMRNLGQIPSTTLMRRWLETAGFTDVRIVDITVTRPAEQRRTDWMTFDSLSEALDPQDPSRTIEGLPAPVRAIAIARRPDQPDCAPQQRTR